MSWLSSAIHKLAPVAGFAAGGVPGALLGHKLTEQSAPTDPNHPGPGAAYDSLWRNEAQRGQGLDQNYADSRNQYMNAINGGQQAFETSARSAVNAALPSFYSALNGVRENATQRGVQNGQLGTSYEGDLASAFQNNIANSIGGQAMNLWGQQQNQRGNLAGLDAGMSENSRNRYADLLSGALDRKQQQRNAKNSTINSIIQGVGSLGGGIIGMAGRKG